MYKLNYVSVTSSSEDDNSKMVLSINRCPDNFCLEFCVFDLPNDKSNRRRLCGVRFGVEELARRFLSQPVLGVSRFVPADFVKRIIGLYVDTRFGVICCVDGIHSIISTSEFDDTITWSTCGLLRTSKGNPSKHFDDSVTVSVFTVSDDFRFDFILSVISLSLERQI